MLSMLSSFKDLGGTAFFFAGVVTRFLLERTFVVLFVAVFFVDASFAMVSCAVIIEMGTMRLMAIAKIFDILGIHEAIVQWQ